MAPPKKIRPGLESKKSTYTGVANSISANNMPQAERMRMIADRYATDSIMEPGSSRVTATGRTSTIARSTVSILSPDPRTCRRICHSETRSQFNQASASLDNVKKISETKRKPRKGNRGPSLLAMFIIVVQPGCWRILTPLRTTNTDYRRENTGDHQKYHRTVLCS